MTSEEQLATPGEFVEMIDLAKRYGDVVAVDRLSLRIPRGGVFGFLGPSGSGKTTTMGKLLRLDLGATAFWMFERRDVAGATGAG